MKKSIFVLLVSVFMLGGCARPQVVTKKDAFPEMYKQQPLSVLVVPAINHSTAADAPELYSTTIAEPLSEAGYYVMPIPLTNMILNGEGIVDGEQLKGVDAGKFRSLFGADAVLYVTINQWDTSYYVTGGNVSVDADFRLVSTADNSSLWHYRGTIVYDTSGGSGNLLVDIISTAISTAQTDYVPLARQVNRSVITTLPVGKYNPRFGQDGGDYGINQAIAQDKTN